MGHLEWWDHSRDPRKRNSKKTSTTAVVETKTKDDIAGKVSAFVSEANNGGKVLNMSIPVSNSGWIIDSGATDHMTFDSRQVSPLKPSSQQLYHGIKCHMIRSTEINYPYTIINSV